MNVRAEERAPWQGAAQVVSFHQRTSRCEPVDPVEFLFREAAEMFVHLVVAQVQREHRHFFLLQRTQCKAVDGFQCFGGFVLLGARTHQRARMIEYKRFKFHVRFSLLSENGDW